ncbi:molybdate ABC transporter substrate-binding protein [Rhodoferax sp.]|uniref:molybdate ABC transporter substrate-binding protein n=1 Tax=Rhodoferax sp. TaxID=50421 RepID=UPI00260B1894|nr:molybdate ABC transporter substrate-binding protein [Rhodoferax sp.]MDD2918380.1 molybdate ABC transporter substrate-binding protein [Rhodoferax sp.]
MTATLNTLVRGLMAVGAAGLAGCAAAPQAVPKGAEASPVVAVYAAGSLRGALTAIAKDYEASTGHKIALTFGASGLLRERIEKGEPAQVFASADNDHPQRLARQGGWEPSTVFVRNTLCALTSEQLDATPATLLATLLRPDVRLGTSTPKADPSGDYTWELFHKADGVQNGAYAVLDAKAQKLVGQVSLPQPPTGRLAYAWIMDERKVDVFLTYCTNAVAAQKEVPRLKIVQIPPELQVGALYGFTVRESASTAAAAFAKSLVAPAAQAVFKHFGFGQP